MTWFDRVVALLALGVATAALIDQRRNGGNRR